MTKEADHHFIVMVVDESGHPDAGELVADGPETYDTFEAALKFAQANAAAGIYSEVHEVVITYTLRRRVEP